MISDITYFITKGIKLAFKILKISVRHIARVHGRE